MSDVFGDYDPFSDDIEIYMEPMQNVNQNPQIEQTQQTMMQQSVATEYRDETPSVSDLDAIDTALMFGHGPVVNSNLVPLTPAQLAILKPEEYQKHQEGWHYQWEDIRMTEDPLETPTTIMYSIPPAPQENVYLDMWNTLDDYEHSAWSAKNVGIKSGWDSIDHAFDGGIKAGFIVIGGDSNLGKSGFMSQLSVQIAQNNPDVFVMDFSLDDPMKDKIPRIVGSMNKVLLNAVRNPNQFKGMQLMLARRKAGLLKLRSMVDRYRAYDANFSTDIEDIEAEIIRVKQEFTIMGIYKQVVVMIDNMHDLTVKTKSFNNDKEKYDFIAQWAADVAIKQDIPMICSAELKKLNGAKRPGLDDIREAVKIKYEAKAVLLVYNEVHYKSEGSSIYFSRSDKNTKQPVFEVHFAKNKFNAYKGRLFFEFYPEMARFEEPDAQTIKTYSSIIFGGI